MMWHITSQVSELKVRMQRAVFKDVVCLEATFYSEKPVYEFSISC